jgi:hypothetical protein
MRANAGIALAALLMTAAPAMAATFDTYEDDGEEFCSLDLQGPDQLLISVEKGKGATGEVWIEFMAERDKSFSTEYELRLEITLGKDTTDAFLGGTEDTSNVPAFLMPLSEVGALSAVPSFSYKIEDRPAETLKGLTGAEVKRLVDCMEQQ